MCLLLALEVILLTRRNQALSVELDRAVDEVIRLDIQNGGASNAGMSPRDNPFSPN